METPDNSNKPAADDAGAGADAGVAAAGNDDVAVLKPMSITVETQNGSEMTFKTKSTTKPGKAMDARPRGPCGTGWLALPFRGRQDPA